MNERNVALNRMSRRAWLLIAVVGVLGAWLAWSPASAQSPTTFRVTITNTASPAMPISPGAYVISTAPDVLWAAGGTASLAIERIAEVGDPTEATAAGGTMIDAAGATGDTVTFEISATPGDLLSFASMLVGSNDGFVGVNGLALFDGSTALTITLDLLAWDAGTEANSDLNSGFAGGQPDPAQGAANVDNGTATSEPIGEHAQFTGAQATLMIEPVDAMTDATPAPAASGNAGLIAPTSGRALLVLLGTLALALVIGGRLVTAARRRS